LWFRGPFWDYVANSAVHSLKKCPKWHFGHMGDLGTAGTFCGGWTASGARALLAVRDTAAVKDFWTELLRTKYVVNSSSIAPSSAKDAS
jgi:hypothetical protein